ncbi:MAG: dienelactone hydrolase family protein [Gammaproteobacteria bacterium]|nr:dienelactone hydrolase family protein [Gammaproteobacteria bacterium]NIN63001.1 dienelactone hydrolase family protein [Gammaproteobacteria bacterium]NIO63297.1 dienelactone hydrolase family protein [Gammaproteobacteria bacterium]NIP50002.1 dienelactone hydrolase family protein [Gammaproteobacteria bacterium]NIQ12221.1 dienelactone hydrolase family protein [Gammaproteobacteria bacterium]
MRLLVLSLLYLLLAPLAHADGEPLVYLVDGEKYEGFYISPKPSSPFILLLHDADGLTEYEIRRANMLAEEGYTVFAADLFGQGIRPVEDVDKRQHTGELYKSREKMRRIMIAALDAAVSKDADINNAVIMGYSFGGAATLELARYGIPMNGFVTFHGGLQTPEGQNYSTTRGKILVLHGGADTSVTMEDFNQLEKEFQQYNVVYEMIAYPGAPHAFTVFDTDRYREDADKQSWERFLAFLKETL